MAKPYGVGGNRADLCRRVSDKWRAVAEPRAARERSVGVIGVDMTSESSGALNITWARLVPELLVADIRKSLRFWRDLCSFAVAFDRLDEGFAYLDLDGAQIMLEERGRSRKWVTGPLEIPLGRGVNFQITVPAIEPIVAALASAGCPLFMEP